MNICLYRVGRNLNRCYRTCEAFGIKKLFLYDCMGEVRGNLYSAKGRVEVIRIEEFPTEGVLALETNCRKLLWEVDWSKIQTICIGGETEGLPIKKIQAIERARIPTVGKLSCLTVEAALSIVLYEFSKNAL